MGTGLPGQGGVPCPEKSKGPEGGAYPGQVAERRCVVRAESEQQEMKAEK